MKDKDSPLDRYAVTEVLCMRCGALQPASDRCVNPKCDPKPFAKYSCRICSLYDDNPNHSVYHCPYCNVCRLGLGLGIDYRHCMRCNACVSLEDDEHQCVPQKLQGMFIACLVCLLVNLFACAISNCMFSGKQELVQSATMACLNRLNRFVVSSVAMLCTCPALVCTCEVKTLRVLYARRVSKT
jgi:hypothetical protein